MSFSKAFQKALKAQGQNIEVPEIIETDPQLVPYMYRAQVQPRCSLQFAGDRKQWQHKVHGDQRQPFIDNLKGKELQLSLSWGQEPK